MLKSVKMHFSGNTEIFGFKKSTDVFTGLRIHFSFKIGTLETVKNRFGKKKREIYFFGRKMRCLTKIAIFDQKLRF